MALIDFTIVEFTGTDTGTVVFRANSAAEMQLKIQEWLNDNDTQFILDVQLQATGAAPNFVCMITIGSPDKAATSPFIGAGTTIPIVLGGIDTVDPVALAAALGAAIRAQAGGTLYKTQIAGGGVGPHWMALAFVEND